MWARSKFLHHPSRLTLSRWSRPSGSGRSWQLLARIFFVGNGAPPAPRWPAVPLLQRPRVGPFGLPSAWAVSVPPATISTADQGPKSCLAQRDKMAPLVGITPNLRAVLTAHVALQFVDGRRLWPTDNVPRHRLVGVRSRGSGPQGRDISRSARRRGWKRLSRAFESEHALVPGDTRQTVSVLPSLGRALRRMPNRTAVDAFARFGAHQARMLQ
jgi:hypothetical protein